MITYLDVVLNLDEVVRTGKRKENHDITLM